MSPDIQAALNAAIIRSQAQSAPAPHPHQMIPQAQLIAQALAKAMANGRLPLGKARVAQHPGHSPVDGGYSGAGMFDPHGNLVARAGFGPHPVPPQMLPPGFLPQQGGQYVQ